MPAYVSLVPLVAVILCAMLCLRMTPMGLVAKIRSSGERSPDLDDLARRLAAKANHHN